VGWRKNLRKLRNLPKSQFLFLELELKWPVQAHIRQEWTGVRNVLRVARSVERDGRDDKDLKAGECFTFAVGAVAPRKILAG
jgi:hypothetical protein